MKPLASAPAAQLGAVRGVIFDVDDTITAEGRLVPAALDALARLHAAGLRLAAVTGRPLGWADVLVRLLPIDLAIGENGAGWIWRAVGQGPGPLYREGYWQNEAERAASRTHQAALLAKVSRLLPEVRLASDQRARRCDLAFDVAEEIHLEPNQVTSLLELIMAHGARALLSSVHAHAVFGTWEKAQGTVRAVREALSISLPLEQDRWVFIGDSGNDADAFAYFPFSVGVANVNAHLKRLPVPPVYVTTQERGLGFAELADLILANRPTASPIDANLSPESRPGSAGL